MFPIYIYKIVVGLRADQDKSYGHECELNEAVLTCAVANTMHFVENTCSGIKSPIMYAHGIED